MLPPGFEVSLFWGVVLAGVDCVHQQRKASGNSKRGPCPELAGQES